jgi:cyclic dehypoxanthinyl futalosine synthase
MGISRKQALDCLRSDDLVGIGMEADAVRRRLHPEGVVSYAIGCEVDCTTLCGLDSAIASIADAVEAGATGLRLRGRLGGDGMEGLLREVRRRFPELWIEGDGAAEVMALASIRGADLQDTLGWLVGAGMNTIGDGPNLQGGSEGCSVAEWIEVHRTAHKLGMRTASRMVFGGGESIEQRIDFLVAVRNLQEETGGFTAFAPVAAEPLGQRELDGVTAVERLKMLAVSRMFLDNVDSVQAGASGEGLKVLQMGLRFGANDAGLVSHSASEEDVRRIIRDAGFQPRQRDVAWRSLLLI